MSTESKGNWYCSFCNDVVNLAKPLGRWDTKSGVHCPVCGHNSAEWVNPKKPVTPEYAAVELAKIRNEISKPITGEDT